MTRDQIDTLSRVFRKAYEGIDANGFYDDAAWKAYLEQYPEIFCLKSMHDLLEIINHGKVLKGDPVAIFNPSGTYEILIMPKDFAEKVAVLGLPKDISPVVEEFRKKAVPRLGRRSKR